MNNKDQIQLSQVLKDRSIQTEFHEIERIFTLNYSPSQIKRIRKCYKVITKLFDGNFKGYRKCNTEYHDLNHTVDALLAASRILDGYNCIKQKLTEEMALKCIIATFFHDTGYIQETSDEEGTGAKYTAIHVDRSIAFLKRHFVLFGINKNEVESISRIIKCTGLSIDLSSITFDSEEEMICGKILGTADLLGQMSQREYLEKLLFLYYEFREANIPGFQTEFDILRKTVDFYEMVKSRFSLSYDSLFEYAKEHFRTRFNIDRNLYIEAIEKNIRYLHKIIDDETTNFRHKLKRGDLMSADIPKQPHHDVH